MQHVYRVLCRKQNYVQQHYLSRQHQFDQQHFLTIKWKLIFIYFSCKRLFRPNIFVSATSCLFYSTMWVPDEGYSKTHRTRLFRYLRSYYGSLICLMVLYKVVQNLRKKKNKKNMTLQRQIYLVGTVVYMKNK
jgi:hypothetical protein